MLRVSHVECWMRSTRYHEHFEIVCALPLLGEKSFSRAREMYARWMRCSRLGYNVSTTNPIRFHGWRLIVLSRTRLSHPLYASFQNASCWWRWCCWSCKLCVRWRISRLLQIISIVHFPRIYSPVMRDAIEWNRRINVDRRYTNLFPLASQSIGDLFVLRNHFDWMCTGGKKLRAHYRMGSGMENNAILFDRKPLKEAVEWNSLPLRYLNEPIGCRPRHLRQRTHKMAFSTNNTFTTSSISESHNQFE